MLVPGSPRESVDPALLVERLASGRLQIRSRGILAVARSIRCCESLAVPYGLVRCIAVVGGAQPNGSKGHMQSSKSQPSAAADGRLL